MFAGLPIALALVGFYEMSLTRDLNSPEVYERLMRDTKGWLETQRSIPARENGWIELKDYFLKQDTPNQKTLAVGKALGKGADMYLYWGKEPSAAPGAGATAERAKEEFLTELPRIQSALSKPYFTAMSTQDLMASSLVPNFILARAVSQGLTSLALESIQNKETAEALERIKEGLQWAKTVDDSVLISLMIGIAQTDIAFEPVEKFVFDAAPSRRQLRDLQDNLRATSFQPSEYLDAMKRDIYMVDVRL